MNVARITATARRWFGLERRAELARLRRLEAAAIVWKNSWLAVRAADVENRLGAAERKWHNRNSQALAALLPDLEE